MQRLIKNYQIFSERRFGFNRLESDKRIHCSMKSEHLFVYGKVSFFAHSQFESFLFGEKMNIAWFACVCYCVISTLNNYSSDHLPETINQKANEKTATESHE